MRKFNLSGLLKDEERILLEQNKYSATARSLVVIDCEYNPPLKYLDLINKLHFDWMKKGCCCSLKKRGKLTNFKKNLTMSKTLMRFWSIKRVVVPCRNMPQVFRPHLFRYINQLWSRFEMYYYFPFNIQAVIIPVYCFGMVSLMARDFTYLQQTTNSVKIISGFLPFLPGLQVNRSWLYVVYFRKRKWCNISLFSSLSLWCGWTLEGLLQILLAKMTLILMWTNLQSCTLK